MRIDDSGFRKRTVNNSLMTRQLILSTRGSKKMIYAMGTPACTFKQLWDNVSMFLIYVKVYLVNEINPALRFLRKKYQGIYLVIWMNCIITNTNKSMYFRYRVGSGNKGYSWISTRNQIVAMLTSVFLVIKGTRILILELN